jgi:ribosomal protein S1
MVKATVLKVLDKGIIMTIEGEEVEAIVPLNTMSKKDKRDYTRGIKVGDELELRVVEVRQEDRKIVLASEDLGLSEEDKDVARVMAKQEDVTQKIEIPEDLLSKLKPETEKEAPKAKKADKEAEEEAPAVAEAKADEPKAKKAEKEAKEEVEEEKEAAPKKKSTKKAESADAEAPSSAKATDDKPADKSKAEKEDVVEEVVEEEK